MLVKSVEFDGSQVVLPGIDTKVDETHSPTSLKIHPDYQWSQETRVNNHDYTIDPHLALHKSEWENEIARHILSVYATSRSNENIHESKSVLKYVDIDHMETHEGVENYVG